MLHAPEGGEVLKIKHTDTKIVKMQSETKNWTYEANKFLHFILSLFIHWTFLLLSFENRSTLSNMTDIHAAECPCFQQFSED